MLGTDEPSLSQMAATSAPMDTGFQPMAFGESGGSVAIDPTNPTIQASDREAQAGFPIVPALIGAGSVPFTQLVTSGGAIPPAPTGQLGRVLRGARTVAGTARTVGAAPITINPVLGTAAALLAAEEAPKAFGSEKSTSEILTELAATTPEERAGAAEYAALGANLPGLGGEPVIDAGVVSKPPTPMMGLETDPQGRMIPAGFKTRAEAFPEYERAAAEREQRLRDQAAVRARFPGGVPVGMINQSGQIETDEVGMPDASALPSEIREIVATPRQMRTNDQRTRLSRFFGTSLGRQFGSESGIMESMMTPLEKEIAEANLELDKQRAADLAAGRKPSDVTYKTNPETGLIEQYVDGRLRNTFRPRESDSDDKKTEYSAIQEAGIKAMMESTQKSREEVVAELKKQGKL